MKRLDLLLFIAALLLTFYCSAALAVTYPVGTFRAVVNDVRIKSADGQQKPAIVGTEVFKQDVIITGKDSKAKILFNNDNILVLGFETTMTIDELSYNSDTKDSQSIFTLLGGKVRAIVKKLLTPTSQFKIKTANSDIGVLGTEFVLILDPGTGLLEIYSESGTLKLENGSNLWAPMNLTEEYYTRIERGSKPADPFKFTKDRFQPVRTELNVYEEITPAPQPEIKDLEQGAKPPEDKGEVKEEAPPSTEGAGAPSIPPIQQEPLTGKVRVKIITTFPPSSNN